jgi:pimeloyl-ACP methyl ester carboxylesterase
MQLYAAKYPEDVAGMVLVDAVHPDLDIRIEALLSPKQIQERRGDLELNQEGVRFEDILASEAQARAAGGLPDVPLVVIRHGIPFDVPPDWPGEAIERLWTELQTDLSKRTSKGKLVVAEHSHHRIQEDQPDVVSDAIREVVDAVRANKQG